MAKQALEGKRGNLFLIAPEDLVIIGIDTKHKNEKEHPLYDPRIKLPVNENLVRNIMVYGVIDPIKVRKEGEDPVVVDGRQRLRAAREANKRLVAEGKEAILVPVIPKRGSDATMFGVLISANENRQNDDILAKIDKAGRMLDMGKTEDEIGVAFGVTTATIKVWLKLLDVCDDVRKAVDAGQISPSAAAKLAGLSRDEQISTLKELVDSGQATTAHVMARARSIKTGTESAPAPSKRMIKKVLAYVKAEGDDTLTPEFWRGVRWAIGDLPTASVGGLSKLIGKAKDA